MSAWGCSCTPAHKRARAHICRRTTTYVRMFTHMCVRVRVRAMSVPAPAPVSVTVPESESGSESVSV
eukprot:8070976-Alexandrium_andersonii.AAC.1